MKKGTVSDRLILKNRAVDLFSNVPRVFAVFVDPRGIPANRWHPKCAENLVKNDANEQRKRAHDTLWGEYFGSQVVPGRGIKGEVNLPLGRGKVKCNFFSNTPWAAGPANLFVLRPFQTIPPGFPPSRPSQEL